MSDIHRNAANRILVVDDDALIIKEYLRCLGPEYEPESATSTLTELEKVLFGDETDGHGVVHFHVVTQNQGEAAVAAVQSAAREGHAFSIVFLDIRMPPGIDGIEAARRIREVDPDVNIVLVTGSSFAGFENLGVNIPPADKIFFFKKPFHGAECRQLAAALCGKWHGDMALRSANEELERRVDERTAALQKLAYYDSATRLPNQLLLLDALQKIIERAGDSSDCTAVVLLDIERFSFINETMGYDSGTELLRAVGSRLSRTFCDGPNLSRPIVGRVGSDEFAVLAPKIENEMDIRDLAELVKATVEEPLLINGRDLYLKAGIGVAWHPAHGTDAKSVFRCADAALHRSMRSIDGAITYYHREMHYSAQHRFALEGEFRNAIDSGQITAFYQPQQSTRTGEIVGVEALARWIRPDGSVVPPSDFIPLSEEMGISDLMFQTIMESVCTEVSRWRSQGAWEVPVSVNLSAHQLRNSDLVSLIKGILKTTNVDRKLINLELTETALLEDLTVAKPVLNDLSAYGVGIHIDDFGTGYSSLSYLAQLPVKTIKIDRSFIMKLEDSATNGRVVQAIIALGRAMGLEVVAEGAETIEQYEIVRRLGCDMVQGYIISKPLPANEFRRWYDDHKNTRSLKYTPKIVGIDQAN